MHLVGQVPSGMVVAVVVADNSVAVVDVDLVVFLFVFSSSTLSTTIGIHSTTCSLHCKTTLFTLCTNISVAVVSRMLLGCPEPHSFVLGVFGTDSVVGVVADPVSAGGLAAGPVVGATCCAVLLGEPVCVALAVSVLVPELAAGADCWRPDL